MTFHGLPIWYEMAAPDLAAATSFYGSVLGWDCVDAGMPGFAYRLAQVPTGMVAGLYTQEPQSTKGWLCYFAVASADAAAAQILDLGGTIFQEPNDIPGTGRFLIAKDRQGATFGLLQPQGGTTGPAFDTAQAGHGQWHQLQTTDPEAARAFYAAILGWDQNRTHDMGDLGAYRVMSAQGQEIAGIMPMMTPDLPPHWLPFFGVADIAAAVTAIAAAGGKVISGPDPVPGDQVILTAQDDQGAFFSLVAKT